MGPYSIASATVNGTTTLNGSTTPITVAPGASITLVMRVTTTGIGTANDWNSSRWALATAAPAVAAMTCVDHANHDGPGTFSETITVTAPAAAGVYNLYLYAYNGDACGAGRSARFTRARALDNVPPTVTINQAVGQADPTNGATINFRVVFSEAVTGFATGDVSFAGSTAGGALVGTVTGGPTTYNVAVTGMTSSGTVVATIPAARAVDLAGNANLASTSADHTVTWDDVAPTVTIDLRAASDTGVSNGDDITRAASLVFDVSSSETVAGLAANDFSNVGTATGCVVGAPAGSGSAHRVTLTTCSQGTVILRLRAAAVTDVAGNANALTVGPTVTVDRTSPTVTIDQAAAQADPTNASPIDFTVVFSEPVSGFATGDVTVGGSSGGVKTGTVTGGPTTYNVAVTGMTTSGTVVATIAAARATDLAGNNNTASSSTDNRVTWDVVPPTVTINQAVAQADPTNGATINFRVVFSEAVTGFATGDVSFAGSTAGGALVGTVTGGPTTYNVAVTGMTSSGTVVATIAAGPRDRPRWQRQPRLDLGGPHGHLGSGDTPGLPAAADRHGLREWDQSDRDGRHPR